MLFLSSEGRETNNLCNLTCREIENFTRSSHCFEHFSPVVSKFVAKLFRFIFSDSRPLKKKSTRNQIRCTWCLSEQ